MKSSVCVVPLKNKQLFNSTLPSKMFEYMACKKPIIVGINGDAKELVMDLKCGIYFQPENPEMLSEVILTYFHDKEKRIKDGENGLRSINQKLIKETLISNLLKNKKPLKKYIYSRAILLLIISFDIVSNLISYSIIFHGINILDYGKITFNIETQFILFSQFLWSSVFFFQSL